MQAPGSTSQGSGALTAEEQQTAAGDVPDNRVFLTFRNAAEGYSIKYPEGWARRGSPDRVTFQDKNNLVRIDVAQGSSTTVAAATAEPNRLKQQTQSLRFDSPTQMTVGGKSVVDALATLRDLSGATVVTVTHSRRVAEAPGR